VVLGELGNFSLLGVDLGHFVVVLGGFGESGNFPL
jgi:hypothetical protein